MNSEDTGRFIEQLRNEQDIPKKDFSEKLGVSEKTVSQWETGCKRPNIEQLKMMTAILHISLNELLAGKRIAEENIEKNSEDNLTNSYHEIKNIKKLCVTTVSAVLALALIFCTCFAVFTSSAYKSKKYEAEFSLESHNKIAVIQETKSVIAKDKNISDKALCTSVEINLDKNDEIDYGYIQLCDSDIRYEIAYSTDKSDNSMKCTISHIKEKDDSNSKIDGISFEKLTELVGSTNFHDIFDEKKDTGSIKLLSDRTIDLPNRNLSDKSDRIYLLDNGKLSNISALSELDGSFYRFTLTSDTNDRPFFYSIYVK